MGDLSVVHKCFLFGMSNWTQNKRKRKISSRRGIYKNDLEPDEKVFVSLL